MKQPRLALAILSLAIFLPGLSSVTLAAEKEKVPSPAQVKRFTHLLPKTPQGVGRPIGDRQAWEAVAKEPAFKTVVRAAEKLMATPIPELPDDLYLDFSRTGNRTRCQR
ncbi:MAG: hypothetical protein ABFD16_19650, partial [Thermoguttaceae bacterium]